MAVHFLTSSPSSLLKKFNDAIAQSEQKGKINTWERIEHQSTVFYTHEAAQWKRKAFFKTSHVEGKLIFSIVAPNGGSIDEDVYAYYHGHLIETFLRHFSASFTQASATATAQGADMLTSKKTA